MKTEVMADVYKIVHPVKFFNDHINKNTRPDGRSFDEFRNLKLTVNTIRAADSSSMVKFGNTTVVCGIKLELARPKAEEPEFGFIVTNVELPALCSSKFRPGPPSDYAQYTSNIIFDILKDSGYVKFTDLCIVPDKLAWVLYCDMICFNYDGSLVDACLTALTASLKTLTLPDVQYNLDTEDIVVNDEIRTPLAVHGLPVATSFGLYNNEVMLTDPDTYEEEMCGGLGANLIVCWNGELLCGLHKYGGSHNLSKKFHEKAMKVAKGKATLINDLINSSIKNLRINSKK